MIRPLDPADLDDGRDTLCGACHQMLRRDLNPPCGCAVEPNGYAGERVEMTWLDELASRCEGCGELQDDCNCTPGDCDCDSCLERRGYDEESG